MRALHGTAGASCVGQEKKERKKQNTQRLEKWKVGGCATPEARHLKFSWVYSSDPPAGRERSQPGRGKKSRRYAVRRSVGGYQKPPLRPLPPRSPPEPAIYIPGGPRRIPTEQVEIKAESWPSPGRTGRESRVAARSLFALAVRTRSSHSQRVSAERVSIVFSGVVANLAPRWVMSHVRSNFLRSWDDVG